MWQHFTNFSLHNLVSREMKESYKKRLKELHFTKSSNTLIFPSKMLCFHVEMKIDESELMKPNTLHEGIKVHENWHEFKQVSSSTILRFVKN
jgi:hypothetical protein